MLATASEIKNGFWKYLKHVTDENGEVANSLIFEGLSVDVKELFNDMP
jgi:hypothetical protein